MTRCPDSPFVDDGRLGTQEYTADAFAKLKVETKTETGHLRADTHTGFGQLRTEMKAGFDQVRTEMNTGFDHVRTEMNDGLGRLRNDMTSSFTRLERIERKLDSFIDTQTEANRIMERRLASSLTGQNPRPKD